MKKPKPRKYPPKGTPVDVFRSDRRCRGNMRHIGVGSIDYEDITDADTGKLLWSKMPKITMSNKKIIWGFECWWHEKI